MKKTFILSVVLAVAVLFTSVNLTALPLFDCETYNEVSLNANDLYYYSLSKSEALENLTDESSKTCAEVVDEETFKNDVTLKVYKCNGLFTSSTLYFWHKGNLYKASFYNEHDVSKLYLN
jgi:hypothetical protein